MLDRRCLVVPWLTLACAHPAVRAPALQADYEPSVQVGSDEALIVFPPDPETDFPWPAQTLTDRFAGPFWNFVATGTSHSAVAAAADLGSIDSLSLPAYPSLTAVVSHARLYDCELDTHIISCYRPLEGTVTVDGNRVLLRITDEVWIRRLNRQRPDSGWLRVDRPNRRSFWNGRVAIRYVPGRGGA